MWPSESTLKEVRLALGYATSNYWQSSTQDRLRGHMWSRYEPQEIPSASKETRVVSGGLMESRETSLSRKSLGGSRKSLGVERDSVGRIQNHRVVLG